MNRDLDKAFGITETKIGTLNILIEFSKKHGGYITTKTLEDIKKMMEDDVKRKDIIDKLEKEEK